MGVRFTVNTNTKSIFKIPENEKFEKEIIITDLNGNDYKLYDNKYLNEDIEVLVLTTRPARYLRSNEINTIRDFVEKFPDGNILNENATGLGVKSINEIYFKIGEWQDKLVKSVA